MIREYWSESDRCLSCEAYAAGHPNRESTANAFFPQGCTCPDDSGSCDWCGIYYGNVEADNAAN